MSEKSIGKLYEELRFPIMGLAMLIIMVLHSGISSPDSTLYKLLYFSAGVDIFFYLSGFGLIISWQRNRTSFGQFMKKRLLRILPTFWILTLILFFFITNLPEATQKWFEVKYTIGFLLQQLFAISYLYQREPMLWFIDSIIVCYLFFPIVGSKFLDSEKKGKFIVITFIILAVVSGVIGQTKTFFHLEAFVIRLFAFFLGIYFGHKVYNKKAEGTKAFKTWFNIILIFLGFLLVAVIFFLMNTFKLSYKQVVEMGWIWYPFPILVHPYIVLFLKIFNKLSKASIFRPIIRLFGMMGQTSLQLFLFHVYLFEIVKVVYKQYKFTGFYMRLSWVGVIVISITGAYVIFKLINKLETKVLKDI